MRRGCVPIQNNLREDEEATVVVPLVVDPVQVDVPPRVVVVEVDDVVVVVDERGRTEPCQEPSFALRVYSFPLYFTHGIQPSVPSTK